MHSEARTQPLAFMFAALLHACIALCVLGTPLEAHAVRKKSSHASSTVNSSTSTKKKGSTKIKHQRSPSEESAAERDRRLYRECWGRPNAGACLGYTRR